jgi:hypothetical protein
MMRPKTAVAIVCHLTGRAAVAVTAVIDQKAIGDRAQESGENSAVTWNNLINLSFL